MNKGKTKLRQWRKKKRMSQRELAQLLGKTGDCVSKLERGERLPSRNLASKLMTVCEINFRDWGVQ